MSLPRSELSWVREEEGVRSLVFDDSSIQSAMLLADPTRLVVEYTRLMMGFLLFQPNPTHVGMIGLGGGSLVKYCAAHLPETMITVVEISPEVIALRNCFGIPPDGPRLQIVCGDGAAFVRHGEGIYDVLLVDGFDEAGQPEQLCTTAFYDDCRARLSDGGILVVNLRSDDVLRDARIARLRDAFSGRIVAIEADGTNNHVVFASTSKAFPPSFDAETVRALEVNHPVGLEQVARKLLHATIPPRVTSRGWRRQFADWKSQRRDRRRRKVY